MENIIEFLGNEVDEYRFRELMKIIIKLSMKANKDGLLSLDNEYPSIQPYHFRKGIELVTEGASPEDIRFIFLNYIRTKKYSENELLEILIIRDSLLFIQNGDSGKILFEKIISMLENDFFKVLDYSIIEKEVLLEGISGHKEQIDEEPKKCEEMDFEKMILNIEYYKEIEKVIVLIGARNMAIALRGCSCKVINHIKNLCADHIYYVIEEQMNLLGPLRIIDILDEQKSILINILNR